MRDRILRGCAALAARRPWTVVLTGLALAVASSLLARERLILNADTDDLISPDRPYMQSYERFKEEFGDLESIWVVAVDPGDRDLVRRCVDELTSRLRAIELLPLVSSAIEPEEQLAIATRAMPLSDLRDLEQTAPAFPALLSSGGTAALLDDATKKLRRLALLGSVMRQGGRESLGASAVFELTLIAAADPGSAAAGEMAGMLSPPEREYLVSDSGRLYFVEVRPVKDYGTLAVIEEPLRRIRGVIEDVRREFPDVEIGLTGKPVLQADEMRTTDADMTRSSIVAVILVAALFMVVAGGVRRPIAAVLALLLAIAWTFGLTTLVVGQLNLLSVVFTLILVGIGIDFGVHVIMRVREERVRHGVAKAVELALVTSGRGNVTGAVTSSVAFLMAMLTDFRGLQELGFVAGSGLLLCLASMTLVLPALLVLTERSRRLDRPKQRAGRPPFRPARPLVWLGAALAVTVIALPAAAGLAFEGNLLELQAEGLSSVEWEHRVLEDSTSASWFGAVVANTLDDVARFVEQARKESAIGAVRSVLDVVQLPTEERDELRAGLHAALEKTTAGLPEENVWGAAELRRATAGLDRIVTLAEAEAPEEARRLAGLRDELRRMAGVLEDGESAAARELKSRVDGAVARGAAAVGAMLRGDRQSLRESLPAALRHRFVAPSGRLLVSLHPRDDVWEVKAMSRFVAAMRRVSPEATGVPITHSSSIADMKAGFAKAALLALAAVVVLVVLDFRRPIPSLLAITPLAVGALWLVETMGLCGIEFNLANFFSVPILIGIGVDNGIHLLHRFREGGADRAAFGSTHRGVFLTSMTSMIGFGCLAFATHRGLQSLGMVMALGCLACLVASLGVLAPLLALIERRRRA